MLRLKEFVVVWYMWHSGLCIPLDIGIDTHLMIE